MIGLSHYLILAAILFTISVVGIFLNRKNIIILLMSIELMLLAVNINFIAFSHYLNDIAGQIFVFFILTVAAAESAIGLAIIVLIFRNTRSINVDDLSRSFIAPNRIFLRGYFGSKIARVFCFKHDNRLCLFCVCYLMHNFK